MINSKEEAREQGTYGGSHLLASTGDGLTLTKETAKVVGLLNGERCARTSVEEEESDEKLDKLEQVLRAHLFVRVGSFFFDLDAFFLGAS